MTARDSIAGGGRGTPRVPPGGRAGYDTVQDEGIALPQRTILDFEGDGVTASDDGLRTKVVIPGNTEIVMDAIAGQAISIGQAVAFDFSVSPRAFRADASVGAGERQNAVGFAANSVLALGTVKIRVAGAVGLPSYVGGAPVAPDAGKEVFLSTTPGAVTLTAPSGSGEAVKPVGVVTDAPPALVIQIGTKVLLLA